MKRRKKTGKNRTLRIIILGGVPVFLIRGMNGLIPFDELQTNVAIGFGIFAGAVALAAAIAYVKVLHWSYAGVTWTFALMFGANTLSMFIQAALWTIFAGAAVGMTIHNFKDFTEKADGDPRRAVLPTALSALALLSYPLAFLASFETSMGASPAFLLGALLLALIGFTYWFHRREILLGLMDVREEYSATAILALFSVFILARRYLEASASPPLANIMLWAALPTALIAVIVAFDRLRKRAKRAAQTPTGA